MSEGEETKTTVNGTVEEVLPNSLFRVRLSVPANPSSEALAKEDEVSEQPLILAYLAGKMRLHRIRVLMGDQVEMVLDPYGGRARIVRRLT
ncbi:MAG: translation initiation factor IF-1 [Patescibacteria group bacterium]